MVHYIQVDQTLTAFPKVIYTAAEAQQAQSPEHRNGEPANNVARQHAPQYPPRVKGRSEDPMRILNK